MREGRQMDKDIEGKGGEKNRETQKEKYRGERQKIDRWIKAQKRERVSERKRVLSQHGNNQHQSQILFYIYKMSATTKKC